MNKKNINRTQLAHELKVTKGYVTQILNGDFDHKVSKLIELALHCNKMPCLSFIDTERYLIEHDNAKPAVDILVSFKSTSTQTFTSCYNTDLPKTESYTEANTINSIFADNSESATI